MAGIVHEEACCVKSALRATSQTEPPHPRDHDWLVGALGPGYILRTNVSTRETARGVMPPHRIENRRIRVFENLEESSITEEKRIHADLMVRVRVV